MFFPIPTPLLRGLFGFMDEQDEEDENEPRGLFGHFAGEFGEDQPANAASGGTASREAGTSWIADRRKHDQRRQANAEHRDRRQEEPPVARIEPQHLQR
jgi:hypothetical protein